MIRRELDARTRQQVFEAVWNRVNVSHFDPTFGGVDWKGLKGRYAPLVAKAKDDAAFYELLERLIGELRQSHFAILRPEAYTMAEASGTSRGSGASGVIAGLVEGKATVLAVRAGSAGEKAAVLPGDVLEAVDGKPLTEALARLEAQKLTPIRKALYARLLLQSVLSGVPGTGKRLGLRRPDGKYEEVVLTLVDVPTQPQALPGLPPLPVELETKRLDGQVGYIRFSLFTAAIMEKLRAAVTELADAPGLVLDLRGNPGGLAPVTYAIAGLVSAKPGSLGTMATRTTRMSFPILPQAPKYTGPLAVLTDEVSASCSEILAGGLQESGRAFVIGRPTPGMVLPSAVEKLPGGVRFQYAFANFKTPKGILLEGRGVTPNQTIPLTLQRLLDDGDPDIKAALAWIRTQQEKKS